MTVPRARSVILAGSVSGRMGPRDYRLSEPPSWPLRGLALAAAGVAATTWVVLPTTVAGGTAPLVPALALEAFFLGGVGAAFRASAAEIQDGIVAVVGVGAVVVGLYTATHWLTGGDPTHPAGRALLSCTVGVAAGLVASIPGFAVQFFRADDGSLGAPE